MIEPKSPIPTKHSPRRIFDTNDTKESPRCLVFFVPFVDFPLPSAPLSLGGRNKPRIISRLALDSSQIRVILKGE